MLGTAKINNTARIIKIFFIFIPPVFMILIILFKKLWKILIKSENF